MAEFLEGQVDVPAVGKVKKTYILIPAGLAAAYVAWRWYQASQAGAEAPAGSDGLYTSSDLSEYGLSTTGGATTVTGNTGSTVTDATNPSAVNTNDQWNERAVERLSDSGYDPQTVRAALGEFLARRSLDSAEASIARAALAAAGQPPEGRPWSVIEAATTGGTATLAAPTGVKVTSTASTTVTLSWSAVTGAREYYVWRNDLGADAIRSAGTSITLHGLTPNKGYRVQVAAVGTTGKVGARSAAVSFTTRAAVLARPATPTASAITRTSFRASVPRVAGATYYRWTLNGRPAAPSDQPYRDFTGLRPGTSYTVTVQADTSTQSPGPVSGARTVKTKK